MEPYESIISLTAFSAPDWSKKNYRTVLQTLNTRLGRLLATAHEPSSISKIRRWLHHPSALTAVEFRLAWSALICHAGWSVRSGPQPGDLTQRLEHTSCLDTLLSSLGGKQVITNKETYMYIDIYSLLEHHASASQVTSEIPCPRQLEPALELYFDPGNILHSDPQVCVHMTRACAPSALWFMKSASSILSQGSLERASVGGIVVVLAFRAVSERRTACISDAPQELWVLLRKIPSKEAPGFHRPLIPYGIRASRGPAQVVLGSPG